MSPIQISYQELAYINLELCITFVLVIVKGLFAYLSAPSRESFGGKNCAVYEWLRFYWFLI
jgi:hypothetical protein